MTGVVLASDLAKEARGSFLGEFDIATARTTPRMSVPFKTPGINEPEDSWHESTCDLTAGGPRQWNNGSAW